MRSIIYFRLSYYNYIIDANTFSMFIEWFKKKNALRDFFCSPEDISSKFANFPLLKKLTFRSFDYKRSCDIHRLSIHTEIDHRPKILKSLKSCTKLHLLLAFKSIRNNNVSDLSII